MPVLSNGFLPLFILKKPTACSYVFSFVSFFSSSLDVKSFDSLNFWILFIEAVVRPEMYFRIKLDAVLMFTPTLFTTLLTVKSNPSVSFLELTSCWYSPTPMLLGSIFTNSDSGSIVRLPILTALLSWTSRSGNSFWASLLAE